MRWQGRRQSTNVEDRRSAGGLVVGGGLVTLVLALIALFFGGDPRALLDLAANAPGTTSAAELPQEEAQLGQFVATVRAETEDVWNELFRDTGAQYREPGLVLFTGRVQSACGIAGAAVGPFYCPGDQKVYLDLSFFEELRARFRAPGDFAQAYVIAHEVGHHVQNLLGTMEETRRLERGLDAAQKNQISVRVELQADYYAGVWAHHAARRGLLETGDVDEALRAASAIGDDRLQRQAQGYVVPDSFTHGTAEQRARWFRRGLETGDPAQGDTFSARDL